MGISLYFQIYLNRTKSKKELEKYYRFIYRYKNPNITEKMNFYTTLMGLTHAIICTDIECTSGRINFSQRQVVMSCLMWLCIHVLILQVTSWIIIIRNVTGRKGHRNKYFQRFANVCSFLVFLNEMVCGQLQEEVGNAKYLTNARDGSVKTSQYIIFCVIMVFWALLCLRYGKLISKQLKSNKSSTENIADRSRQIVIKRYCYTTCWLCFVTFVWRMIYPVAFFGMSAMYQLPPCRQKSAVATNGMIIFVQYSILYAIQPMPKKLHTRLIEAASTNLRSSATSQSRASSNRTTKKSSSVKPSDANSSTTSTKSNSSNGSGGSGGSSSSSDETESEAFSSASSFASETD